MFLEFHLEIPGFKKSQLKRLVRKNLKRVFLQTTFFKMAAVTSQNLLCRLASNLMQMSLLSVPETKMKMFCF
jgi:hypothetical protein